MKKSFRNCMIRIISLYLIIPVLISFCLYFFLPTILNYPPDSINNTFQIEYDGLTYTQQYFMLIILVLLCNLIILFIRLFKMYKKIIKLNTKKLNEKQKISSLINIRSYCYNTPYLLYFLEILLPLIFLPITFKIIGAYNITIIKICSVYISSFMLASVISFVFSKNEFGHMLNLLHDKYPKILDSIEVNCSQNKRSKIKSLYIKILLQVIPLIFMALIFTSLVGYEQSSRKTGEIYYNSYANIIGKTFETKFYSKETMQTALQSITLLDKSHKYFIIDENGQYYVSDDSKLRPFFIKYVIEKSEKENGHSYDYYCLDTEGIALKTSLHDGTKYYVGIIYDTYQPILLRIVMICDIILFAIISIILAYVSYSLSYEISTIAKKLSAIGSSNKNNINLNNNLVITSEDEIADLSVSFNQIQAFTKDNIDRLQNSQDMLMEKERLASLGQLIGGISHNLKTPIMSISGATEGIQDLINEYEASVGDPEVTVEDHHEIAKDMKSWIEKIKNYTEYMSDIITAVKGQAVNMSGENSINFTVDELLKRVDILMKHELKNALVTLNTTVSVDKNLVIAGDVNALVQVVNNMISNAIQSYNGQENKEINLSIEENSTNLIISIQDFGSGMSKEIQNKLFKNMITTKGKNGSGLGLFMSYSTIKAHFNGSITFHSEVGKGTIFYINIPKK